MYNANEQNSNKAYVYGVRNLNCSQKLNGINFIKMILLHFKKNILVRKNHRTILFIQTIESIHVSSGYNIRCLPSRWDISWHSLHWLTRLEFEPTIHYFFLPIRQSYWMVVTEKYHQLWILHLEPSWLDHRPLISTKLIFQQDYVSHLKFSPDMIPVLSSL